MKPNAGAARTPGSGLTIALFVVYLLLLVGLILFKFPFNYETATSGRHLNLIPFAGSLTSGGLIGWSEVVENVIVFVPYGIYVALLRPRWSFGRRLVPIVVTTVAFETIQFVFAIGRSDITDVLSNTLGGALGISIYIGLARLLGAGTRRVLNVVALALTMIVLAFWAFLGAHSIGAANGSH